MKRHIGFVEASEKQEVCLRRLIGQMRLYETDYVILVTSSATVEAGYNDTTDN